MKCTYEPVHSPGSSFTGFQEMKWLSVLLLPTTSLTIFYEFTDYRPLPSPARNFVIIPPQFAVCVLGNYYYKLVRPENKPVSRSRAVFSFLFSSWCLAVVSFLQPSQTMSNYLLHVTEAGDPSPTRILSKAKW